MPAQNTRLDPLAHFLKRHIGVYPRLARLLAKEALAFQSEIERAVQQGAVPPRQREVPVGPWREYGIAGLPPINHRPPGKARVRAVVLGFARELDRMGLAKFAVGRNGRESVLELSVGRPLAEKLLAAAHAVDPQPDDLPKEPPDTHLHVFRLREGRDVELRLPKDLSRREAERIAMFVQSLPLA